MNIDKDLLRLTSKTKSSFITSIISGFIASIFTILLAYYLAKSINLIFLENKNLSDVSNYLIYFIVAAILKAFFIWYEKNKIEIVVGNIKKNLREAINKILFEDKGEILLNQTSGELSNTVIKGVEALDSYFSEYLPQLFLSALTPFLILLFVFPIDILSGVVFLATAPLIPLLMYLIGSSAEEINRKHWKSLSRMSGHFLDVLQGITTLKMFNRAKDEIKRIEEISNSFKSSTMKVLKIAFLSALVLELLSTLSIAIIAVEIGLRLMYGNMQFESALFVLILAPEFYLPLRQLGSRYHAGLEGLAAFKSIQEIFAKAQSEETLVKSNLDFQNENIEFSKVSFSYENRNNIALNEISFTIERGKTTAIVGESGSGKTTIINMLMRFLEPSSGEILVDQNNLINISEEQWYSNISWVSQNPHIFHKSIYENISIAKENAAENEIIDAAKNAFIHDSIVKLKDGYHSLVGENGATLSGGEIQRIALARAFLKKSPIWLMDEPTSSIDSVYESDLLSSIKRLAKGKTVVIVAHRLNTILSADKIIVLEKGKIIGEGTHANLLAENKIYQNLYNTFKREI
ncbi:MAG: thiol reductant ABC exporter subunit CydD [Bacteroidetes bacterium]|nr:thiol reductant ABC exporter subunit CydD [Bacteroidota bacterium]MBU1115703.1 thiol reductant ABC exporter subunit CydD [Bacteroidota bacterium]MBU1799940.1 thiol reductant ABC exporter subunit CydD [Bacteroidota bacterium]